MPGAPGALEPFDRCLETCSAQMCSGRLLSQHGVPSKQALLAGVLPCSPLRRCPEGGVHGMAP